MPVTTADLEKGVRVLRDLGATRVMLFGSANGSPETAADLDLACEGVPPEKFFYAAGRLLDVLGKPVDLIDLSRDNAMNRLIRSRGRLLYEAR